jgi:hypothetical protein
MIHQLQWFSFIPNFDIYIFMDWVSAIAAREFLYISNGINQSYVQHLLCSVGVIAVGGVDS